MVASYTIAKRLLKLWADLMTNITRAEGKPAIGEIPSLNGTVGCRIISGPRGIAGTVSGGGGVL